MGTVHQCIRARTFVSGVLVGVAVAVLLAGTFACRQAKVPAGSAPASASAVATGPASAASTGGAQGAGADAQEATPLARASWKLPRLAELGRVIEYGPEYRKEVALTFNAAESKTPAGFDKAIVDVLKREDVEATVFLAGKWVRHNRDAVLTLAADKRFELANNSWDYPDFSDLTTEQIRAQIERTDALIEQVSGQQPVLFRLPYGSYNMRTLRVLEDLKVPVVQWDVVSGDPDPNVSAEAMTREILTKAQPGSIVIMHINGRGVHTAEALPGIIRGLRKKGFDLVTVSALLR